MSEWLKILISALAGMATSLTLEPIRHWVGRQIAAREARIVIYRELATQYDLLNHEFTKDEFRLVGDQILTESFDYYFDNKREIIHLLPHHVYVVGLFGGLKTLKRLIQEDVDLAEENRRKWINRLELGLLSGFIHKSFIGELPEAETLIDKKVEKLQKLFTRVQKKVQRRKMKEMPSILHE